jgi:hypothetical protein
MIQSLFFIDSSPLLMRLLESVSLKKKYPQDSPQDILRKSSGLS